MPRTIYCMTAWTCTENSPGVLPFRGTAQSLSAGERKAAMIFLRLSAFFQVPVCFATAAAQMARCARLSSSCLWTGALSDVAQSLSHVYDTRVGFPGQNSYGNLLRCLCSWDSVRTEWMGSMPCLCSTRPFLTARGAPRLFCSVRSIRRLKPQFLHWSFDFSVCFAEQEWERWKLLCTDCCGSWRQPRRGARGALTGVVPAGSPATSLAFSFPLRERIQSSFLGLRVRKQNAKGKK